MRKRAEKRSAAIDRRRVAGKALPAGARRPVRRRSGSRERSNWRPLLDGAEAKSALEAVEAIAEGLVRRLPGFLRAGADTARKKNFPRNASLAGGMAGLALFCGYVARAGLGSRYERAARRFLEAAGEDVGAVTMRPSLYSGFVGVAWAFSHLERQVFRSTETTSTDAVDEALRALVRRPGWQADFDLVVGLVGLGVYALERLPAPAAVACLEAIVDRLDETSRRGADGISWYTAPEFLPRWQLQLCPRGYYNLGLAHGCPGVIGLLAAALAAGVRPNKTRKLLDGGVAWLLNHRRGRKVGTRFSAWIAPGLPTEDCRSA